MNPPFDTATTHRAFSHIRELFENNAKQSENERDPLSFFVVVPLVLQSAAILKSTFGKLCRHYVEIHRNHWYLMGNQHKRHAVGGLEGRVLGGSFRARVPTILCWLQNDEGNSFWPPTKAAVNEVVNAFMIKPDGNELETSKREANNTKQTNSNNYFWRGVNGGDDGGDDEEEILFASEANNKLSMALDTLESMKGKLKNTTVVIGGDEIEGSGKVEEDHVCLDLMSSLGL